jgi:hypothetical protein
VSLGVEGRRAEQHFSFPRIREVGRRRYRPEGIIFRRRNLPALGPLRDESKSAALMYGIVTTRTECNQIFFRIITGVAAKLFVMDLESRPSAAQLTFPAITP